MTADVAQTVFLSPPSPPVVGEGAEVMRDPVEVELCQKLVKKGLAAGYRISVYDGEDCVRYASVREAEILEVLFETKLTKLRFLTPIGKHVGDVVLIYGNGEDVISHWSDNVAINELIEQVIGQRPGYPLTG
jgi:hypothetical protein